MQFINLDPNVCKRWDYLKFLSTANGVLIKSIAEIGTSKGENAAMLRRLFPHATLYLIDPYSPIKGAINTEKARLANVEDCEKDYLFVKALFKGDKKAHVIRETSLKAAIIVPSFLDLVFLDGDHSYESVKQDIYTWKLKVRNGGILSGHHYNTHFPGVIQAVNESLSKNFIVGKDSVWASIKKGLL